MTVRQVNLGSAFRTTWISSGATASPIAYNLLTGSETLVASYAGVSSGDGHYYADPRIDTPGLWKGVWFAFVSPNSYRGDEALAAFPYDTDQPGRYITWNDVINRFTSFGDVADAVKAASHYLHYVEAELDSRLGSKFVVPFSSNNITAKDLVIDMVYLRSIRWRLDGWKDLKDEIDKRVEDLVNGDAVMVTNSGDTLVADQASPTVAWSNTQDYHPTFAVNLDHIDMVPDSAHTQAEADERGF